MDAPTGHVWTWPQLIVGSVAGVLVGLFIAWLVR